MYTFMILGSTYTLTGYIGEMQGERDEMQDAYCIKDNLASCFNVKPKNA